MTSDDGFCNASFILNYLQSSLKLKDDQWTQFIESDNGKKLMNDFFESQIPQIIYFSLNRNGILTAYNNFSFKNENKICYFIKYFHDEGNENPNSNADLLFGDLQPNLLKSVSNFLQSVN